MTTAPGARFVTLDIIRGIAVMGIFSVNVIGFAMITPAYLNPGAFGGYHGADLVTWLANFVIVDGKLRSLFSMLFGASILLVIERAQAAGKSPASVHYPRMIVLLGIGLIHFYVIWHGDILVLYAAVGMVAFLFRDSSIPKILLWAAMLFAFTTVLPATTAARLRDVDLAAHSPRATPRQIQDWNASVDGFVAEPATDAVETRAMRSPLPDRVAYTVSNHLSDPLNGIGNWGFSTLGLMLVGMAGYRSGFLTGAWPDRAYRRIAIGTLAVGGLLSLGLGLELVATRFYFPLLFAAGFALDIVHLAMALGYAALIILLTRRPGLLSRRVAAVGRAAFSNYLGTSILAALVFYGDGLALFGRLSRFEAWLFVPLFWLLMLAWSKPWLDRFHYGPLEWLWRSLARFEPQPLRKA